MNPLEDIFQRYRFDVLAEVPPNVLFSKKIRT
jgi:hypothetical protein